MANLLNNIPENITEYPNSFKRQGAFPLEAYSVFYSLDAAKNYAKTSPISYVGQIIVVVANNKVDAYKIIDVSGGLQLLATSEDLAALQESLGKQITDISDTIASKIHFSVVLVDDVNINNNTIKLKGGSSFKNAEYGVIYLLPTSSQGEDIYKEYMLVQGLNDSYSLLLTGTTSTDLSDYVRSESIETLSTLQNSIVNVSDATLKYLISYDNKDNTKPKVVPLDLSAYALNSKFNNYSDNTALSTLLNIQNDISKLTESGDYIISFNSNSKSVKVEKFNLDNYVQVIRL